MIFDQVAEAITKVTECNVEDIKPETELESLGIDSLQIISLIFELEEAFDIEIPNEALASIVTVADIIEKLELSDSTA